MREIRIEISYTKRDEDSLNRYLKDIDRIPTINIEEEILLSKKIKTGDQLALQKLVRANLRFVISVAKKYQGNGLPLSDLINEGNLGLIRAAEKFDATKGFKFISYAVWWIRQSMLMALSENTRIIRVPMHQIIAIQKIRSKQTQMEQILERKPTTAELAAAVEMKDQALLDHLYRSHPTLSLDKKISEETDLDLASSLTDPNMQATDEPVIYASLQMEISRLLTTLKNREHHIILELFGLGDLPAMSTEQVADRNGLSKERVRQIKATALRKLKNHASERLTEHFQN